MNIASILSLYLLSYINTSLFSDFVCPRQRKKTILLILFDKLFDVLLAFTCATAIRILFMC